MADDPSRYNEFYWGSCLDLTSPDACRVADALLLHLDAQLGPPPGALDFNVFALVRHGEAILVPRWFHDPLVIGRRRLEERGWSLLDGPTVHVIPETADVIVTRRLGISARQIVDRLPSMIAPRRQDEGVADGTYPIRTWYFLEPFGGAGSYSRPAATRIAATALAVPGGQVSAEGLARVATLFDVVSPVGVAPEWKGSMLPALLTA